MERRSSKEYWWKAKVQVVQVKKSSFKGVHPCFLHGGELALF